MDKVLRFGISVLLLLGSGGGAKRLAGQSPPAAGRQVAAETLAGADLGAKLAAADTQLGSGCGTITVSRAGQIGSALALRPCHSLRVNAMVHQAAPIVLSGRQTVSCGTGGGFTGSSPAVTLFQADNLSDVDLGAGCAFDTGAQVVDSEKPVTNLRVHDATISHMNRGVVVNGGGKRLTFDHNRQSGGQYGFAVIGVAGASCTDNTFTGTANGCEFWGGDADPNHGGSLNHLGSMTDVDFSRNHCTDVVSCAWGSMGLRVSITYNVSDGCGDTCTDAEGSAEVVIDHNTARRCGNFCASVFFGMKSYSMSHNRFDGAIAIKNSSNDPNQSVDGTIAENDLTNSGSSPGGLARCFFLEAAKQLTVANNRVTNCSFQEVSSGLPQHTSLTLRDNGFTTSITLKAPFTLVAIGTGINGSHDVIRGNRIVSTVRQPDRSTALTAALVDFNSWCSSAITNNTITGFPISLNTNSGSGNGGVRDTWTLNGNNYDGANTHTATGAHGVDVYTSDRK